MEYSARIEAEVHVLRQLAAEIRFTAANLHPSHEHPQLGSVETLTPADPASKRPYTCFDAVFPLVFSDGMEWEIVFPLYCTTGSALMSQRILSEVVTMSWVGRNTTIPVPKVIAYDVNGLIMLWNSTNRPCIIMEKLHGKHIKNRDWECMTPEQQFQVVDQIARVQAQLVVRPFDKIGSLESDEDKTQGTVGRLVSEAMIWLSRLDPLGTTELFESFKMPYSDALSYFVDLMTLRLVNEVDVSPSTISTAFIETWIMRSLVPSSLLDEFNYGPFVLQHGFLDRTAVLFDENYKLTGVVKWGFSRTEPIQSAAAPLPFVLHLPTDKVNLREMVAHYAEALKRHELEFPKRLLKFGHQPLLADFLTDGELLHVVASFAESRSVELYGVWDVFKSVLGYDGKDKEEFLAIYKQSPLIKTEFDQIRSLIQTKYVCLLFLLICRDHEGETVKEGA